MQHRSDPRILGRRTLERDHRALVPHLRPGLDVLDVGCGTGAITSGIARRAARAVGVDRDPALLEIARREHPEVRFELADAADLPFAEEFDVVTAARTLQWIARPERAVASMVRALKPGGVLLVLDYDHARNTWSPDPPPAFRALYQAFLDWRAHNGWDNEMGSRAPALLAAAGLEDIAASTQDEAARPGDPAASLWVETFDGVGAAMVAAGFVKTAALADARRRYAAWVETGMVEQTLALRATAGRKPRI